MAYLGDKEDGLKDLKDASKMKFSNPIPWHFMALYYKEEKNYDLAMKNYAMALKYDNTNFNVFREQSYLQLYLRHFKSFLETSKKCIELKPNLVANWVTYSFANYLNKNYLFAEKILDSAIKLTNENENNTNKAMDLFELISYKVKLMLAQENYEATIKYLLENEKSYIDKSGYKQILQLAYIKTKNYQEALSINSKLIQDNSENMEYIISRFRILFYLDNDEQTADKLLQFTDLLEIGAKNAKVLDKCLQVIKDVKEENKNNKELLKSSVFQRIELACLSKENGFEDTIRKYFQLAIETSNPTIISNLDWLYKYQKDKANIIDNLLNELNNEVLAKETVFGSDLIPHLAWFNFGYASHLKKVKKYSEALDSINKAIDTTPTVIEFFTLKSEILKRLFKLKDAEMAYEKARKLDVGDRFLNAKLAKASIRAGSYLDGERVMHEFVKGTLDDESIEHIQTQWYILEVVASNLRKGEIPIADRLLRGLFIIFNSIYEDQFDFFNYCLRRNVVNQLIEAMDYMDKVYDNSSLYKGLELLDYLFEYTNHILKDEKTLEIKEKEFAKLNNIDFKDTKYKFQAFKEIRENIIKKMITLIPCLQAFSKKEHFHYLAVKFSLLNSKLVFAIKSLNFLKLYKKDSIYYTFSMDLLAKYLSNSEIKIDTIISGALYDCFPEFKSLNDVLSRNKEILDSKISKVFSFKEDEFKDNLQDNFLVIYYFYYNTDLLKKFLDGILNKEFSVLKHVSYKMYSKLMILSRLFVGDDYANRWDESFKGKFSEFTPNKTIYNLDMYDIYAETKKPVFTK